jgi:hypothetical protein
LPIYSDVNKNNFIGELKKRINNLKNRRDEKISLHLNIYDSNEIVNEILFEILYLGVLNHNNKNICILP